MADPVTCCVCCCVLSALLAFVVMGTAFAAGEDGARPGPAVGAAGHQVGVVSDHPRNLPSEQVWQSFALLNQLRADGATCPGGRKFEPNGTPLLFDCALFRAAQRHSEDMAKNGFLSNYSPSGGSPQDRAEEEGSPATGENVARGQAEAYQAIAAWQASEGACVTMMDPDHKLAAVGLSGGAGFGGRSFHWTQMLADSSVSADQSCVPPNMPMFGHATKAVADEPVVGKVGKTWRVGEARPADGHGGGVSTTNPTGGFKFLAFGQ